MSSGDPLPSGTYVIQAKDLTIMIADPNTSGSPVKTEKDQTYKWVVTYYEDDKNYTIRAAEKKLYAVTDSKNDNVYMDTTSQRFNISYVSSSQNTVYYEIETTGDDQAFQYEGNNKQVLTVNPNGAASVLWTFEECSPYTISSETSAYFESDPEGKLLRRFGLSNHFTWDELWECIDDLNANAQGAAFYKLFLLGRHGHNEHNIQAALGDDYDGIDAALTQRGCGADSKGMRPSWAYPGRMG